MSDDEIQELLNKVVHDTAKGTADALAPYYLDIAGKAAYAGYWEGVKVGAQAGADALYRMLLDTGALAAADRVVVKEVVRDRNGVITAFVERQLTEADVEAYRR